MYGQFQDEYNSLIIIHHGTFLLITITYIKHPESPQYIDIFIFNITLTKCVCADNNKQNHTKKIYANP